MSKRLPNFLLPKSIKYMLTVMYNCGPSCCYFRQTSSNYFTDETMQTYVRTGSGGVHIAGIHVFKKNNELFNFEFINVI